MVDFLIYNFEFNTPFYSHKLSSTESTNSWYKETNGTTTITSLSKKTNLTWVEN